MSLSDGNGHSELRFPSAGRDLKRLPRHFRSAHRRHTSLAALPTPLQASVAAAGHGEAPTAPTAALSAGHFRSLYSGRVRDHQSPIVRWQVTSGHCPLVVSAILSRPSSAGRSLPVTVRWKWACPRSSSSIVRWPSSRNKSRSIDLTFDHYIIKYYPLTI